MEYINVNTETVAARARESAYETLEWAVTEVWQDIFLLEKIDPDANFFELGGNSLLGMDIAELLATRLGAEISVLTIFQHPTIREITGVITANQ